MTNYGKDFRFNVNNIVKAVNALTDRIGENEREVIRVLIAGLGEALTSDEFDHLAYMMQDAPREPFYEFALEARLDEQAPSQGFPA